MPPSNFLGYAGVTELDPERAENLYQRRDYVVLLKDGRDWHVLFHVGPIIKTEDEESLSVVSPNKWLAVNYIVQTIREELGRPILVMEWVGRPKDGHWRYFIVYP